MLLTDVGVKTGLQAGSFCCLNWYKAARKHTHKQLLSAQFFKKLWNLMKWIYKTATIDAKHWEWFSNEARNGHLIFGNPRKRGFNQESHLWIVRRMIEEEENDSSKCWILPLPSFIFSPLQLYIAITPFAIPIQIRGGSGSHGGSKGKGRSRIAWA